MKNKSSIFGEYCNVNFCELDAYNIIKLGVLIFHVGKKLRNFFEDFNFYLNIFTNFGSLKKTEIIFGNLQKQQ